MARNKTDPEVNFDALRTTLLNSSVQKSNPALFQVINKLLDNLTLNNTQISARITEVSNSIPSGGSGSSVTPSDTVTTLDGINDPGISDEYSRGDHKHDIDSSVFPADYVVMSDGGLPTPLPVDDGFGNFVYISYVP